ncbi:MAG TPA: SMC family ATPase [Armatimonadota bacterium]|jgi:DNA repair exonuclease SbcCD ATPase subunit
MIKLLSIQANNFKQLQDVSLRFPAVGSVLIEGRNEAGKSTLFEAVFFALFGKTLLSGTTVEDLVGYQATEGIVILEIASPGGRFLIQRKVKRSKTRATAEARLKVYNPDGTEGEEIRGSSAVNDRLQQELKLDSDAFLNSCFVEQKKLEKLEGMTAADREKSLMRLLNMDRMLDDERSLRITIDDSRRLQRLEQRVKLAEVMAEIPGVQRRGRECKMALDIIAIKDNLAAINKCDAAIVDAQTRIAALEVPIKELEERVRRLESVRAAVSAAEIIGVRLGAIEQQARDIDRLRTQLAEMDRTATEELPALRANMAILGRLRGRWSRLIALDAEAGRAKADAEALKRRIAEVEAATKAVSEMESRVQVERERITALEAEERELAIAERAANVRQALEDWLAAVSARDGVQTISAQAAEAHTNADVTERRLQDAGLAADLARRSVVSAERRSVVPVICAAILAWFATKNPVPPGLSWVMYGFSVVLVLIGLALYLDRRRRVAALHRTRQEETAAAEALREAQNAYVRLEGQMENARATSGAAAGRLEQAVTRLEALEEPTPSSSAEADARLDSLPGVGGDLGSERLSVVRRDLGQAQGAIEEQLKAISARQAELAASNVAILKATMDRLETWVTRVREAIIAPWADAARERGAELRVDPQDDLSANREATALAEAGLAERIRLMERNLSERPAMERRISLIELGIAKERDELLAAWPPVAAVHTDATVPETAETAGTLRTELADELDSLDEAATRAELKLRREERNAAENDRTVAQRESASAGIELRRRADALKYPPDAPLTAGNLAEALPGWDEADPADRAALDAEFEELKELNAGLMARRADLASALGLDPSKERMDPAVERAQRDDMARDQAVREKAIAILRNARERIMGKVLPYTIEHMRRILPALTMERYHDAKLTPDYKIEVWDERASMWKSKNIFSGGTRDQFSLALRLAFAVATLPQERGAAPGFIFLDEPLSSFDAERSEALMYLLTKGEIAETFDQILVISHSQAIAADEFQYRLKMNEGRVEDAPEEMRPLAAQMELAAEG